MSKIPSCELANPSYINGMKHQDRLNQETQYYYESLTEPQRHEILDWLKENLIKLPILAGVKTKGLEELLAGKHQYPPALLLVRQALKRLNPKLNFNLSI